MSVSIFVSLLIVAAAAQPVPNAPPPAREAEGGCPAPKVPKPKTASTLDGPVEALVKGFSSRCRAVGEAARLLIAMTSREGRAMPGSDRAAPPVPDMPGRCEWPDVDALHSMLDEAGSARFNLDAIAAAGPNGAGLVSDNLSALVAFDAARLSREPAAAEALRQWNGSVLPLLEQARHFYRVADREEKSLVSKAAAFADDNCRKPEGLHVRAGSGPMGRAGLAEPLFGTAQADRRALSMIRPEHQSEVMASLEKGYRCIGAAERELNAARDASQAKFNDRLNALKAGGMKEPDALRVIEKETGDGSRAPTADERERLKQMAKESREFYEAQKAKKSAAAAAAAQAPAQAAAPAAAPVAAPALPQQTVDAVTYAKEAWIGNANSAAAKAAAPKPGGVFDKAANNSYVDAIEQKALEARDWVKSWFSTPPPPPASKP